MYLNHIVKSRLFPLIILIILTLITILIYLRTFNSPFILDDYMHIVYNPAIRSFNSLWQSYHFNNSRLLGYLTYYFNYQLNKLDVTGYHLINLTIHLANTILVWNLTKVLLILANINDNSMKKNANFLALMTAAIFCLHPMASGAVNYIVQRFELMASFFYLASLLCFGLSFASKIPKKQWLWRFLCIVMMLAGFFSKETAYSIPLMFCIIYFVIKPKVKIKLKTFLIWSGLISVIVLIFFSQRYNLTSLFNHKISSLTGETISSFTFLLTQTRVLVGYLGLMFLPLWQNFDHVIKISHSIWEPQVMGSLSLLIAIILLAIKIRKPYPIITFAVLWFFTSLSVSSSIIPISDVMVEHRSYLGIVSYALFLVLSIFYILKKNNDSPRAPFHSLCSLHFARGI